MGEWGGGHRVLQRQYTCLLLSPGLQYSWQLQRPQRREIKHSNWETNCGNLPKCTESLRTLSDPFNFNSFKCFYCFLYGDLHRIFPFQFTQIKGSQFSAIFTPIPVKQHTIKADRCVFFFFTGARTGDLADTVSQNL